MIVQLRQLIVYSTRYNASEYCTTDNIVIIARFYTPSVLVPGLDLRVREVELGGELHPVLHRQVLLPLEAGLQRLQLRVSEGRPCLPLLLGETGGVRTKAVLVCKESRL